MNERIKELADQAGFILHQVEGLPDSYVFNKEKFAELIVRECANEILKWKDEPFPFDEDFAARLIMDHFGIKRYALD